MFRSTGSSGVGTSVGVDVGIGVEVEVGKGVLVAVGDDMTMGVDVGGAVVGLDPQAETNRPNTRIQIMMLRSFVFIVSSIVFVIG